MVEVMRVELGAGVRPVVIEGELFARRVVTVSGVIVVLMTFLFSFGNVLNLGLYLGVPETVAWLVAPALDVTVIGLVVGIRHLSMHGASGETLKPVRIMLIMAGIATLVLNTADALLVRGHFGAAAYDAVGPVLLMAWTEAGPWFLRQFASGGVLSNVPSGVPVGSHVRSDVPVEHVPDVRSGVPSGVQSDVPVVGSEVLSEVPVIGSGRTVRDRLVKLFASNPEAMGWRHVDLAAAVGCSRSAVTRVLPVPDV